MQSRKCGHALSIPHSVSQREKGREEGGEREGDRERELENMVPLFLFLKGMAGALAPFSYLVCVCIYISQKYWIY
jgi:hypothetical protein